MAPFKPQQPVEHDENAELSARLREAEETLQAIRTGAVDAIVAAGPEGDRVYTLRGADYSYRVFMEAMSEGAASLSADGGILWCNPRLAEIVAERLERVLGSSIYDYLPQAEREPLQTLIRGASDRIARRETFLLRCNGERVPALLSVRTVLLDGVQSTCLVATDLTEQRRLRSQLMLADRMSTMGLLAAGVAHEINNPLAFVATNLELALGQLAQSPGAPDITVLLEQAREGAERIRVSVRDLLAFCRVDEENLTTVDLRRVLDGSVRLLSNQLRYRVTLQKDYEKEPLWVRCNEGRLGQVFINLLSNALQAIPDDGTAQHLIRVLGRSEAEQVIIEVQDDGAGIAPEHLGRLFEPFFTTKPLGKGLGLGLSICHAIVTASGGRLSVQSTLGQGTTFRVVLPESQEPPGQVAQTPSPSPVAAPQARSGSVLIVDDERVFCVALKATLSRANHEVVAESDPRAALTLLQSGHRFDVILCDMMMPHLSGMQFYQKLLEIAPEQAKRIVFMTAGTFSPAAVQFLAATPNARIDKPVARERLLAVVQRILERG